MSLAGDLLYWTNSFVFVVFTPVSPEEEEEEEEEEERHTGDVALHHYGHEQF